VLSASALWQAASRLIENLTHESRGSLRLKFAKRSEQLNPQ